MALLAVLGFTACNSDELPTIDFEEFGYNNEGAVSPGGEFHMDAEIVATGTIDEVSVEIHPEGEHMKGVADGHEWEVDTVFAEYSGLKNATFHEHIEVPADAPLGDYHFHMIVKDMEGFTASYEAELEVKEGVPNEEE